MYFIVLLAGNFFENELPAGDLYILAHILHGWDDTQVDILLQRVYSRLPPGNANPLKSSSQNVSISNS